MKEEDMVVEKEAISTTEKSFMDVCYPTIDPETGKILMNGGDGECCYYNSEGRIRISTEEETLFETLMNAAKAYETGQLHYSDDEDVIHVNSESQRNKVELRVAGGWVRDKLLGMNSDDVDIALDTLMGVQFAKLVQKYLHQQQSSSEENSSGDKKKKKELFKIGVICANPEQSKHLETATMRINGMDVDFVNLRAQETYDENSRIPTVQFGTPLEDALRRDFTVNALFYNIRTRQLEDWTGGRGMSDLLQHQLLVTPFHPFTTFHDDPLRVLRAIRFAIRFNLSVHPDIRNAAIHPKVQQSLMLKVSRERIGKELEGMLSGKSAKPHQALSLISQLQLANCIFSIPPILTNDQNDDNILTNDWSSSSSQFILFLPSTLQLYNNLRKQQPTNSLPSLLLEHQRLLHLAVFLLPFKDLTYLEKKKKTETVITYIIRESIKFKNKDVTSMQTIMSNLDKMEHIIIKIHQTIIQQQKQQQINDFSKQDSDAIPFCRLEVGLLLRNLKELWPICCLLVHAKQQQNLKLISDAVCRFFQLVQYQNLNECWKHRPLLDGRALIPLLNLPKGPSIGKYLQKQTEWMLLHPNGTKDECANHLKTIRKRELENEVNDDDSHKNKKMTI